jgi:hypothetical protein
VCAADDLILEALVPDRVQQENVRYEGKVQADSADAIKQKDGNLGVVAEHLQRCDSLLRASLHFGCEAHEDDLLVQGLPEIL